MSTALPLPDEAAARRQLDALELYITQGVGPSWDGEDVVTLLEAWTFTVGSLEVGHKCCVYPDYPDSEVWVPMMDPVHSEKLKEILELVETLIGRLTADIEEQDDA